MATQEQIEYVLYTTIDPETPLTNCPALTTLLHRVCNGDPNTFEEACRIVSLFINTAIEKERNTK